MATAFAVFCETDGSLSFYKRDTVPTSGNEFNGKIATAVYTGIETSEYTSNSDIPWYDKRESITNVSFADMITPISTAHWFDYCITLTTINNITNLNTSNVTNMHSMFDSCNSLTTLDVSNFDTSQVTNMHGMFFGCNSLTTLDLSNFDTSKVTTMDSTFSGCHKLTTLDVSNFDTSQVTSMFMMFYYCKNLTTLDVSNFDTSQVGNMNKMFSNCQSLTTLDISTFDTSQVTTMTSMFSACKSLITIYVSDCWSTDSVTSSNNMFNGCTALSGDIAFDSNYIDITYATYIGGYLTYKENKLITDYLIKGKTLIDIAKKIRVLSDIEDTMTPAEMQTALDTHNAEMVEVLTTQDDLIAQITTVLEGKAGASVPSLKCFASFFGGADFQLEDVNGNTILQNETYDLENFDLSEYVGELVIMRVFVSADISIDISDYGISFPLSKIDITTYALSPDTYVFVVPNHDIVLTFSEVQ